MRDDVGLGNGQLLGKGNSSERAGSPSSEVGIASGRGHAPLQLNIERLVLHGFPVSGRHRVGAAVQQELTRLFVDRGVPPGLARGRQVDELGGLRFEMSGKESLNLVGVRIARSIYRGVSDG